MKNLGMVSAAIVAAMVLERPDGGATETEALGLALSGIPRANGTDLMRHAKGELILVSGRVQRNTYTARDGHRP